MGQPGGIFETYRRWELPGAFSVLLLLLLGMYPLYGREPPDVSSDPLPTGASGAVSGTGINAY